VTAATTNEATASVPDLGLENEELLRQIDQVTLSERLMNWKAASQDASPVVCAERAEAVARSWQGSEGKDLQIRRALLLAHIFETIPVHIHDWQLLAGAESEHIYGVHPDIEICPKIVLDAMSGDDVSLPTGSPVVTGAVSPENRERLVELANIFKDQAVTAHVYKAWKEALGINPMAYMPAAAALFAPGPYLRGPLQFDRILKHGLRSLIEEARERIAAFQANQDADIEKLYFWQSLVIVYEGMLTYARRHAEHARQLAEATVDPDRKRELLEIASVCERVPESPARTMQEGLQTVVFLLLGIKLETPHLPGDSGRVDQYLWELFKDDYAAGRLTFQQAAELFGCFLSSRGSVVALDDPRNQDCQQTVVRLSVITLGGVDREGNGADNLLTYLFLHVGGLLALPEPHLTMRWHPDTPESIWHKAHKVSLRVGGNPQFVNDQWVEEYWTARGLPIEDVRDQSGIGCLPPVAQGVPYYVTGAMNQAKILELALHNGVDPLTGIAIGTDTGDPTRFEDFDQLLAAHKAQYRVCADRLAWQAKMASLIERKFLRVPFFSGLMAGCLEHGHDLMFRDHPNFMTMADDRACVDAADSLMAIKQVVFEDKRISMAELIEAIDGNFDAARGEEIRQLLLAAPKYGNDIDEVDRLAGELGAYGGEVFRSHIMPDGKPIEIERPGVSWHYFAGKLTDALPNGRRAKEPLNDATLSPMRGQDRYGPTGVFRSVFKAGFRESLYNVLNQRISPSAVRSRESMGKLCHLTRSYMKHGGMHVQYNIVDTETMRRAQEKPEEYRDLVVRIGGFSAYFVQLTREVQDDVIMRSEQDL